MKHLLLILPLLFWLGCEDESEDESEDDSIAPIYGLWEWRYFYNEDWEESTTINWWSLLSEDNYSERYLHDIDTDSACYSDWSIVDDDSTSWGVPSSWEISGEDSATVKLYWDEDSLVWYVAGLKAVEDTLYWYHHMDDLNMLSAIAVRIESHDFTPECD